MTPDLTSLDGLDIKSLVDEWAFWHQCKMRGEDQFQDTSVSNKVLVYLDKLIQSKNTDHRYVSLTNAAGETVDWFRGDSWA